MAVNRLLKINSFIHFIISAMLLSTSFLNRMLFAIFLPAVLYAISRADSTPIPLFPMVLTTGILNISESNLSSIEIPFASALSIILSTRIMGFSISRSSRVSSSPLDRVDASTTFIIISKLFSNM